MKEKQVFFLHSKNLINKRFLTIGAQVFSNEVLRLICLHLILLLLYKTWLPWVNKKPQEKTLRSRTTQGFSFWSGKFLILFQRGVIWNLVTKEVGTGTGKFLISFRSYKEFYFTLSAGFENECWQRSSLLSVVTVNDCFLQKNYCKFKACVKWQFFTWSGITMSGNCFVSSGIHGFFLCGNHVKVFCHRRVWFELVGNDVEDKKVNSSLQKAS